MMMETTRSLMLEDELINLVEIKYLTGLEPLNYLHQSKQFSEIMLDKMANVTVHLDVTLQDLFLRDGLRFPHLGTS